MRILVSVERGLSAASVEALADLQRSLEMDGLSLLRVGIANWWTEHADLYFLCLDDSAYAAHLSEGTGDSDRLRRTMLLGCDLPWTTESDTAVSIWSVLENFGLGGAFRTRALERWQDAPSAFVGPKALMDSMGTNAMKGFSSENYCAWFAAPGATLGAFLRAYIPVLLAHTRA